MLIETVALWVSGHFNMFLLRCHVLATLLEKERTNTRAKTTKFSRCLHAATGKLWCSHNATRRNLVESELRWRAMLDLLGITEITTNWTHYELIVKHVEWSDCRVTVWIRTSSLETAFHAVHRVQHNPAGQSVPTAAEATLNSNRSICLWCSSCCLTIKLITTWYNTYTAASLSACLQLFWFCWHDPNSGEETSLGRSREVTWLMFIVANSFTSHDQLSILRPRVRLYFTVCTICCCEIMCN